MYLTKNRANENEAHPFARWACVRECRLQIKERYFPTTNVYSNDKIRDVSVEILIPDTFTRGHRQNDCFGRLREKVKEICLYRKALYSEAEEKTLRIN